MRIQVGQEIFDKVKDHNEANAACVIIVVFIIAWTDIRIHGLERKWKFVNCSSN